MRKDVALKKEYLHTEQNAGNLRIAAYRGRDTDGTEKCCLIRIAAGRIDKIDICAAGETGPGDVYMGVILNRNGNIAASFADIGRQAPVFVPGDHKPGTLLPLIIKTLPYREKLAKASACIPPKIADIVSAKAEHALKGACLYKAPGAFEKSIELVCETPGAKWVTEDEGLYEAALKAAADKDRIVLHKDTDVSLCALYGLTSKLDRVFSQRVSLKSGAEIVITETEAICVIDVNSAKSLTGKDKEETFLKLNLEAVGEIITQISARDLCGIIMVDLINMKDKNSETILIDELRSGLSLLDPPARLEDITKLGIAEISRRRLGGSISQYRNFIDSTILTQKM